MNEPSWKKLTHPCYETSKQSLSEYYEKNYASHLSITYGYIRKYISDPNLAKKEAEDAISDFFVKFWEKLSNDSERQKLGQKEYYNTKGLIQIIIIRMWIKKRQKKINQPHLDIDMYHPELPSENPNFSLEIDWEKLMSYYNTRLNQGQKDLLNLMLNGYSNQEIKDFFAWDKIKAKNNRLRLRQKLDLIKKYLNWI